MINIDFNYIATLLPGPNRRDPIRLDWLKLLSRSSKESYNNFKKDYERYTYLAGHTYQNSSIEHLINNDFSLTEPAYIEDGEWITQLYLPLRDENYIEDVYIYNRSENIAQYLYNRGEISDTFDFIVYIHPSDISFKEAIRSLIKPFVQGGKSFDIRTT